MLIRIRRMRRGLALITTLFFMILLYGVAASYCALIPTELRNALRLQDDAEAFYTADSGISDALAQMEFQVSTDHNNFENNINGTFWVESNGIAALSPPAPKLTNAFLAGADARQLLAVKTWAVNNFSHRSGQGYQVVLERWAFKVRGERGPDAYRVVSRSVRDGRIRRTVESWCIQKNFANYAYFVDRLPSEIWLDLNTFRINGPYHTNNRVLLSAPHNWSDGQQSSFLSQLSMPSAQAYKDPNLNRVVDGVRWNSYTSSGLPYNNTTGAINETRYQRVINGGAPRIHQTADNINLPADASKIETAAFGASIPSNGLDSTSPSSVFGTTSSVDLHISKASGGNYPMIAAGLVLDGDAAQITLSAPTAADGNGVADDNTNCTMNVTQGSVSANVTTVYETFTLPAGALINGRSVPTSSATTLSFANNQVGYTVVRDGTSNRYAVYEGVGNGAIYINGNINGLRGVNRGRKTIATSQDSGGNTAKDKKIWLNGALTRADTPVNDPANANKPTGTRPTGVRDQLGLVSYAVRMKRDDVTNPFVPTRASTSDNAPILLYAAIFAGRANDPKSTDQLLGGGMGTDNYNVGTRGYFRLYGSLTEGTRQVKGTFNSTASGGTGYAYQYNYDTNFSYTCPPFFPGTSGFRLASWSEAPYRQQ